MKNQTLLRLSGLALVVVAVGAMVSSAIAAGGGFGCPDVYAPVICSNGKIYPNQCYANLAKAKNCVPYGQD